MAEIKPEREKHEPAPATGHAPVLAPEEARQGVISGRVRLILAASLTLAAIAFAILYGAYV